MDSIDSMFTTRRTITIARAVAILSASATYALSALFFNVLIVTGSAPWMCAVLAASAGVWLADTYQRAVPADYTIRMTVLGSAYGVAAAGIWAVVG